MTQSSRPWSGRTPAYPGDAGSYTAEHWWNVWGPMLRTSNKLTFPTMNNMGVFLGSDFGGSAWVGTTVYPVGSVVRPTVDNYHAYVVTAVAGTGTSGGSEPTWPTYPGYTVIDNAGANQITWTCLPPGGMYPYSTAVNAVSIAPGVAIVDGNVVESTSIESFVIPNATAGNVRDDRIVARKTFGAATQTTRLALLTGSESVSPGPGTPPALTQSRTRATYWDIPIARVSVTDAGVITVTDERVFADAYTKSDWIPTIVGWDTTGSSQIYLEDAGHIPGVPLDGDVDSSAYGNGSVPSNFISKCELEAVFIPLSDFNGILLLYNYMVYGECGESRSANNEYNSTLQNIDDDYLNRTCIDTLAQLEYAVPGTMTSCELQRDATVASGDTYSATILAIGWYLHSLVWR